LFLVTFFIGFFGISFLLDFLVWIIELVQDTLDGSFGTVEFSIKCPLFWREPFFFDFNVWPLKYNIICSMPSWWGDNHKIPRNQLTYTWHYLKEYDYGLMSLKRLAKLETKDEEPIEDWQKTLVWLESFKWTPEARNKEDDVQLWSEGIALEELRLRLRFLKGYESFFMFDKFRIWRAASYSQDFAKWFYYRYELYASLKKFVLSTDFFSWTKIKKKWQRSSTVAFLLFLKVKYYLACFITKEYYGIWLWAFRLRFYFFISLIDFFFFLVNFVGRYILAINGIDFIFLPVITLVNFCSNFLYVCKFNLSQNVDLETWFFLYNLSWKFLFYYEFSFDFLTNFNFFVFNFFSSYFAFYCFGDEVFLGLYAQRSVWSTLLKFFFTFRDYVKSLIDIFYLDYTSFVHQRYTYVAYYIRSIKRKFYPPKKQKRRFLKRLSVARYLVLPNSIMSGLIGNAFGRDSDSKFYWKFRRYWLTFKWMSRYHKLYRSLDLMFIFLWVWILFCSTFFCGFRKFFTYKQINDFNGFFYWIKVRSKPKSELLTFFGKLDRKFIKAEVRAALWEVDVESSAWLYDYSGEIYLTESARMKEFYKASLHEILKRPTSFVWRLRRLEKDYVRNWNKIEFYFFNKSTENYFAIWLEHSKWLNIVMFELMLISSDEEFCGLNLNSVDDEDDFEDSVEYEANFPDVVNALVVKLFYFYFKLDKEVFNFALPEWSWHKTDFLYYSELECVSDQFTTVSFENTVSNIIGPVILWTCFIPGFFFFWFRLKLHKKGWKHVKWASFFWRIVLLNYCFDSYAEGVNFMMRAYFYSHSFFLWRGKFAGKSFSLMRKRKIRWRRRFIWHYLVTCYSDFMLFRSHINQPSWKFLVIIRTQAGGFHQAFDWFPNFWFVCYFFLGVVVIILARHKFRRKRTFSEELLLVKTYKEFILHLFDLEMYFHKKKILRHFCKK
jgi:hypothetical protein